MVFDKKGMPCKPHTDTSLFKSNLKFMFYNIVPIYGLKGTLQPEILPNFSVSDLDIIWHDFKDLGQVLLIYMQCPYTTDSGTVCKGNLWKTL